MEANPRSTSPNRGRTTIAIALGVIGLATALIVTARAIMWADIISSALDAGGATAVGQWFSLAGIVAYGVMAVALIVAAVMSLRSGAAIGVRWAVGAFAVSVLVRAAESITLSSMGDDVWTGIGLGGMFAITGVAALIAAVVASRPERLGTAGALGLVAVAPAMAWTDLFGLSALLSSPGSRGLGSLSMVPGFGQFITSNMIPLIGVALMVAALIVAGRRTAVATRVSTGLVGAGGTVLGATFIVSALMFVGAELWTVLDISSGADDVAAAFMLAGTAAFGIAGIAAMVAGSIAIVSATAPRPPAAAARPVGAASSGATSEPITMMRVERP